MSSEPLPRLAFVGAGAIGAGVGALLAAHGTDVLLVARGAHACAMAQHGVDLRLPGGPLRVRAAVGTFADIRDDDLIVLCTMGHDTEAAIASLAPDRPVVSFQNGVAPLEVLAPRPVVAGMLFVPAERRAPGVVALAGTPAPGCVLLGRWPSGLVGPERALAEALRRAGFRAEPLDDIAPWIRAKAITNLGGTFAALCDAPPTLLLDAVVAEARACFAAAGMAVVADAEFDARIGGIRVAAVDGLPRVGGSTRHALARGDRLETATLHGWFCTLGARFGVPTPTHAAVVALAERASRERWPPGALDAAALTAAVAALGGAAPGL